VSIFQYFKDHTIRVMSQFQNLVGAMKSRTDEQIRDEAAKQEKPINVNPEEKDLRRYLEYCISMLKETKPSHALLLQLRVRHATHDQIAARFRKLGFGSSITGKVVKLMEKDAIRYAKDAVRNKQRTGTPLFGEVDPLKRKGLAVPI